MRKFRTAGRESLHSKLTKRNRTKMNASSHVAATLAACFARALPLDPLPVRAYRCCMFDFLICKRQWLPLINITTCAHHLLLKRTRTNRRMTNRTRRPCRMRRAERRICRRKISRSLTTQASNDCLKMASVACIADISLSFPSCHSWPSRMPCDTFRSACTRRSPPNSPANCARFVLLMI